MESSRIVTLFTILTIAAKGVPKMYLLSRVSLSQHQVETVLKFLINQGLLRKDDDLYQTTEKGLTFVERFMEIQSVLEVSKKNQASQYPY